MSFCGELKQSTSVTISIGPFIDKDDGDTEKTGLTIQDTDVYLSKNGAAKANPNDTNDCTEDANGVYRKQLNTTDTGTLGILTVYVHFSDCLYVKQVYNVLRADVYDSKYGSDYQQVDVVQIGGDTQSATDLKDFADAGYDPATNKVQGVVLTDTTTDVTNRVTANTDQIEGVDATNQIRDSVLADSTLINGGDLNTLSSHDPGATLGTADPGDEMNLADDAITSAKFDEATAFPLASADSGNTQVARTGADGDTLETISDEIDAVPTAVENRTEMDNNSTKLANLDQSLSTTESNIRGTDSDDLKDISDEIGALNNVSSADVETAAENAIDTKFSFTGANVNSDPQDKAGYSLSAAGIDAIHDEVMEGTVTMRQMLRIFLAALAGKTTGGGTNTYTARNIADSKARITMTVDANKNRTVVVIDGT